MNLTSGFAVHNLLLPERRLPGYIHMRRIKDGGQGAVVDKLRPVFLMVFFLLPLNGVDQQAQVFAYVVDNDLLEREGEE
jgi:hypothetical protein